MNKKGIFCPEQDRLKNEQNYGVELRWITIGYMYEKSKGKVTIVNQVRE